MSEFAKICLFAVSAYIVGCFNAAYIISKLLKNADIREHGSGNAGTTNVLRVYGFKAAVPVFLFDALKGYLAMQLPLWFNIQYEYAPLICAIAVVAGHNWPVFMKFKGGKGVASTIGVGFALNAWIVAGAMVVGVALILKSKMVSLGAMIGLLFAVAMFFALGQPWISCITISILSAMSIIQHNGNIMRIIKGTENKFEWDKKNAG